jgi:uncharacterized NAD-dependent epimerase/dehydratase family protein
VKGFEEEGLPVRSLTECIAIYEAAAAWSRPPGAPRARVVAVAMNTFGSTDAQAREAIARAADETGLPTADAIREGAAGGDRLAKAILAARVPAG